MHRDSRRSATGPQSVALWRSRLMRPSRVHVDAVSGLTWLGRSSNCAPDLAHRMGRLISDNHRDGARPRFPLEQSVAPAFGGFDWCTHESGCTRMRRSGVGRPARLTTSAHGSLPPCATESSHVQVARQGTVDEPVCDSRGRVAIRATTEGSKLLFDISRRTSWPRAMRSSSTVASTLAVARRRRRRRRGSPDTGVGLQVNVDSECRPELRA